MTARILVLCIMTIAFPVHAQFTLTTGLGCAEDDMTDHAVVPRTDILIGSDVFLPVTDDLSLFLAAGGYFDYRYIVEDFRYIYNVTLDLSYWMDAVRIKPSIKAKGEQYYGGSFTLPDEFSHSFDVLLSFDIDRTTISVIPGFDWEKSQYEVFGAAELTFTLFDGIVLSGGTKVEKSLPSSLNDELSVVTNTKCTFYPAAPFTISATLMHTYSDSDFIIVPDDSPSGVEALDYNEFAFSFDASTVISDFATLTIAAPLAFRLKLHDAFSGTDFTGEKEWLAILKAKSALTLYAGEAHRLIIAAAGEWILSNSPYQNDHSFSLSVAYEYFFEPGKK